MPTSKDAGHTTTASRKRQLPAAEIQDHLNIHKIKRCKISTIQLAEDLLYEILVRLPVKSLIRFRRVSKGMRRMIDTPFFAKNHFNHRCVSERFLSGDDYAIILGKFSGCLLSVNFSKDNLNCANAIKLDFTFSKKSMFSIGCCNGVFCLKKRKAESYVLWNPSNGTFHKVQCPKLSPETNIITNESIGYDYVNDDYKIARVRDDTKSLEVYSFRKNSWRTFNEILPPIRDGVCVNGVMHWLSSNPRFIAVFDFATETFRSLPLPQEATQLELRAHHLKDLGGRLCVATSPSVDVAAYTVWVMEQYGVESSWTNIYSISSIPFYYFPNREWRLLCNSGWLTWWDPQDNSYERIRFPGSTVEQPRYCLAHVYVRNLVRLDQSFI